MATVEELKQDLIDHMMGVDKSKLSMMDLGAYCGIVKTLDDMSQKPDFPNLFQNAIANCCSATDGYRAVAMKEG